MKTFKEYLAEQAEVGEKLKHLQHVEDLTHDEGASGFAHAIAVLKHAKNHVESAKNNSDITQKIDGCIHGDSMVVTKNGVKKISELTNTDEVKCFDIDTGLYSFYKNTVPISGFSDKKFIRLAFENGGNLICTFDHPILMDSNKYATAVETVLNSTSTGLLVTGIFTENEKYEQWDLSTPTDNFVVSCGGNEIVVHNSPSTVVGHHPENGKYFVASKSAFNKEPKINYSHQDIERNHGHAPGLVAKLKTVFDHAHKILPKHGVFQGDVLHSSDDVVHGKKGASFKPNTITYTAKGEDAKKVKDSKLGIALHTEYTGKTLADMAAGPILDHTIFKRHRDVFNAPVTYSSNGAKMSAAASKKFDGHLAAAKLAADKIDHDHIKPHVGHINTYINHTVRTDTVPGHAGLLAHMQANKEKAVASVKTEKAKAAKTLHHDTLINQANTEHKDSLHNLFAAHQHVQAAKDQLVAHMDRSHVGLESSINGKQVGPEGYVSNHGGRMTKLVNRGDFSRANFATFGKK